jgi:hypothetical protein
MKLKRAGMPLSAVPLNSTTREMLLRYGNQINDIKQNGAFTELNKHGNIIF